MSKSKKMKRISVLLLAAAMALTGPAESAADVQAAQIQDSETEPVMESVLGEQDESAQENESVPERISEEAPGETISSAELATEAESSLETTVEAESSVTITTETESSEDLTTEAESSMGETDAQTQESTPDAGGETVTEELTENLTEEPTRETETAGEVLSEEETTEEATEEVALSAQEKEDAVALTVNKKEEFVIKKDKECSWYSFIVPENGVYELKFFGDDFDSDYYDCRMNGQDKKLYMYIEDYNNYEYKLFEGRAGEIVYIQPYVYDWIWEDYGYDELTAITASIEIHEAGKGMGFTNSDGKHMLSYNDKNIISLEFSETSTSIRVSASCADVEDESGYLLGIYCNEISRWDIKGGYINYEDIFSGLDINTEYHFEYVVFKYDEDTGVYNLLAWFDGTGMPFDVSTKQTDKVGGELRVTTTDFGSITVEYELFHEDTAGRGGYLRYRKVDETDWLYEEAQDDETGRVRIYTDSGSTYVIELVSRDKEIVYDSKMVTTENYAGSVMAEVREDSITSTAAEIGIKGFDTGIGHFIIKTTYTDNGGKEHTNSSTYWSNEIKTGTVIYRMSGLEAGTEYQNVRIWIETETDGNGQLIYAGKFSFRTREPSIKEEDIDIDVTSTGQQTADIVLEVKGIQQDIRIYALCEYRRSGDGYWQGCGSWWLTNTDNIRTIHLKNLDAETDYELRFEFDGMRVLKKYCHTYNVADGVKPEVKVTNTFVNGLELECMLRGVSGEYICYFEIYDGYWKKVSPYQITLNDGDMVRQKFYSNSGIHPGQTQKWRYRVCQNGSECFAGSFESETKPLDLEIISVESHDNEHIQGVFKVNNWTDIIMKDNKEGQINAECQIRKKDEEEWQQIDNIYNIHYISDGIVSFGAGHSNVRLEPRAEYEIRLVSVGDENIVYGSASFATRSVWNIWQDKIVYKKNGRQYITIYDNYEKPAVEVEDENIVSVKEIRQSRIYLDTHNIGKTELYITADGITKKVLVEVVAPLTQDLYYLEGADTSLEDIAMSLPANFKWVDGSESPKADNENKIQYFDVEYKEKNSEGVEITKYASVPVAVGKLDSIEICGRDTVGAGKEGIYGVNYSSTGYDVRSKIYKITQKWSGNENLIVTGSDIGRSVTIRGGNTADTYDLILTVTVKNLLSGKECEVEEVKKVRIIEAGLTDNLIIQPAAQQPVDGIPFTTVSGSVISGTVIMVNYDDYIADQKSKVQMEAKTDTGNGEMRDVPSVSWKTENAEVVEVSDTGLATIKGMGEGRILVTAKDDGKCSTDVVFKVYDSGPVLYQTLVTVMQGELQGTTLPFGWYHQVITDVKIVDEKCQLEVGKDYSWYLRTKSDSVYSEKKTEQITLEITTDSNRTYLRQLDVIVVPKPTGDKDTVTFKQIIKPNLFYADSEAVFEVGSSYEIEDIRTMLEDRGVTNFHVKRYDAARGQLIMSANKLNKDNIIEYTKKESLNAMANIEVKFKGFSDYVKFNNIKVFVQNKPVSLKTEAAVVTAGVPGTVLDVLSGKEYYDISGASVAADSVTVKPAAQKDNLTATVRGGQLYIEYKGTGTAQYSCILTNDNWTKDIKVSGKVSKLDISKLSLKASRTKAIINTTCDETVRIGLPIKGNSSMPIELKYQPLPNDALIVVPSKDNKSATIRVDKDKTIKSGKYTIKFYGEINGEKTKATNVSVTVTDKMPSVKLSAKGSINMANRELSGVTYTASVKNTEAELSSVEIMNQYSLWFSVKKDSGKKLTIKALKDAKNIRKNQKYPVKLRITLSNGQVLETTVNVKLVNKLPSIKVTAPKKPTIDRNTGNNIPVRLDAGKGFQITKVVLADTKGSEYFDIVMSGQNTFVICLAENQQGITSKTYTLKFQVHIAGADNTKPVTKSIKVTVR